MAFDAQKYNLLVVSDLHLSEGRRAVTCKYSTREDFFFDHEFARFLAHYGQQCNGKPWHLIINGDFVDFLQVTASDGAPEELCRGSRPLRYGLDCGELESAYKLRKIVEGHQEFFLALSEFITAGNALTIIKGNHDVEFHYPTVQQELIAQLQRVHAEAHCIPAKVTSESVRFEDWFYYEPGLLWMEHGHQYDEVNVFPYHLSPLLPGDSKTSMVHANEIDLPWGSLFVRYLFNDIEQIEPFADNIKPQTEFIRWLFRHHPMVGLRYTIFETTFLLRKLRRAWVPAEPGSYAGRREEHESRLKQLASETGISGEDLRFVDRLRARSLLKETSPLIWKIARVLLRWRLLQPVLVALALAGAIGFVVALSPLFAAVIPDSIRYLFWDRWNTGSTGAVLQYFVALIRWFVFPIVIAVNVLLVRWLFGGRPRQQLSELVPKAAAIAKRLRVRAVLMGHTHDADLRDLGDAEYFNTGTWTKVFSEEERLIRDDLEFVFVQGLRTESGLQLKLMEWDDAAQEPRLLKLFEDEARQRKGRQPQRPA